MSAIVLVDTSVLLNVLRVPNRSASRASVMVRLEQHIRASDQLLLPMATVLETGNHIAQNGNGSQRRQCATEFVDIVRDAAADSMPWSLVQLPDHGDLMAWLDRFPDYAAAETGLGDVSIIGAFEQACRTFQGWRVTIWSLDGDLQGYDRAPV